MCYYIKCLQMVGIVSVVGPALVSTSDVPIIGRAAAADAATIFSSGKLFRNRRMSLLPSCFLHHLRVVTSCNIECLHTGLAGGTVYD